MNNIKAKIIEENGAYRYFDRDGNELHDGDMVRFEAEATIDGKVIERRLYLTEDGELGVDATNPAWLERGYAPCSFGIYPIHEETLKHCLKINETK